MRPVLDRAILYRIASLDTLLREGTALLVPIQGTFMWGPVVLQGANDVRSYEMNSWYRGEVRSSPLARPDPNLG